MNFRVEDFSPSSTVTSSTAGWEEHQGSKGRALGVLKHMHHPQNHSCYSDARCWLHVATHVIFDTGRIACLRN